MNDINVGGITSRSQAIEIGGYWKDQRFEYSDYDLIYRGCHFEHDAATDDLNWSIWKYTYTGDNIVRVEGPFIDAWDDRALLDWG